MKYLRIFLPAIVCLVINSGCNKLDLTPTNRFTEDNFWTTSNNVNNALNDIYNRILAPTSREMTLFRPEVLSDNAIAADPTLVTGSFTSSALVYGSNWSFYYNGINPCNQFIQSIDKNTTLTPAVIARMKGEARFIRAWFYYGLMNWWGDVPLITTVITADESKALARTPKATVLKFITDELDFCAGVLPTADQYAAADKGRITKGAALALKARVLLYQGDRMADVADLCQKLMTQQSTYGTYALATKYGDLFSDANANKNSNEIIFAFQFSAPLRTWTQGIGLFPPSAGSNTSEMGPTQELVDSYLMLNGKPITDAASGYDENNPYVNRDPRLTATVVYDKYVWTNPNGTTQIIYIKPGTDPDPKKLNEYNAASARSLTGYFWRKYFDPNATAGLVSGLNQIIIRYAEVLLDYAEAKNSLGQMDATVWDVTIKPLRIRAGFTDPAALNYPGSAADITNIIRNERRSEFAMEGLRIDDIRRWKLGGALLNGFAHGARFGNPAIDNGYLRIQQRQFDPAKGYLWPIPESELALDKNLTQNPGY